jgi:hypothetical protein
VVLTRKEREHIEEVLEGVEQSKLIRVHNPGELEEFLKRKFA